MTHYQKLEKKNVRVSDGFKFSEYPIGFLKATEGSQPSYHARHGSRTEKVEARGP